MRSFVGHLSFFIIFFANSLQLPSNPIGFFPFLYFSFLLSLGDVLAFGGREKGTLYYGLD